MALAARVSNRDFVVAVTALLRHFHDLPRLILRVKKVEATHVDWCKIYSSLGVAQKILDHIGSFVANEMTNDADRAFMSDICSCIDVPTISSTLQHLQNAIDFQQSEAEGALEFNEQYDDTLDQCLTTWRVI